MTTPRVLVVEDDGPLLHDMTEALQLAGCSVAAARTVREALAHLGHESFDVAILEHRLCGEAATAITDTLGRLGTPYIACAGDSAEKQDEFWADAAVCVAKRCDPDTLIETVRSVAQV